MSALHPVLLMSRLSWRLSCCASPPCVEGQLRGRPALGSRRASRSPPARHHAHPPPPAPAPSLARSEKEAEVSGLKQAVAERDVKLKAAKGELLESRMALQQKDSELKVGAG